MPQTSHIGLIFDYSTSYCRSVLRGIKRYAERKPDWILVPVISEPKAVRSMTRLEISGLISWVFRGTVLEMLRAMRRPWVSVCGVTRDGRIPRVGPDDMLIGQMAARHLLDCGIREFAFIGHTDHAASARRELAFRQTIERAGYRFCPYHERGPQLFDWRVHRWTPNKSFRRWVLSLPKPVGVATFYDMWGVQLAEVCRESGLHVPEEVAIVGIGNDDLLCELARPSLSSVALPTEQIGFEAAALLDRLMRGCDEDRPDHPILLPPIGVVARQSSDLVAVTDPDVAAAVRLIRQRVDTPLRVGDVLREVPTSRRALERKFRKILNRGVSEEIRRVRLERARSLLANTALPMPALAEQAGFSSAKHLSAVFREETGQTPTSYRRKYRGD